MKNKRPDFSLVFSAETLSKKETHPLYRLGEMVMKEAWAKGFSYSVLSDDTLEFSAVLFDSELVTIQVRKELSYSFQARKEYQKITVYSIKPDANSRPTSSPSYKGLVKRIGEKIEEGKKKAHADYIRRQRIQEENAQKAKLTQLLNNEFADVIQFTPCSEEGHAYLRRAEIEEIIAPPHNYTASSQKIRITTEFDNVQKAVSKEALVTLNLTIEASIDDVKQIVKTVKATPSYVLAKLTN